VTAILAIENLSKTYESGHQALKGVTLSINRGEIFALLGPNGAGKTTLIGAVCGLVEPTAGAVVVDGVNSAHDARAARQKIGLVPQELTVDMFESVWATVSFSRRLFGLPADPDHIEKVLRALALWDKRDAKTMFLSGGMKRRTMIAKALAHEPEILFLDEPTAGVDVKLRKEMWDVVSALRDQGVTIILTTHYLEEAEEMADRIGVIRQGELIVSDTTANLMQRLGRKVLTIKLAEPLTGVPEALSDVPLTLADDGRSLQCAVDSTEAAQLPSLLRKLETLGIKVVDLSTRESSLEEIFLNLVEAADEAALGESQ